MKNSIVLAVLCIGTLHTQAKDNPKNSLSVMPVSVTHHTATGIGLQYERMVSNKISLALPLSYTFGKSNPCDATVRTYIGYANPGVKYYPAGNDRIVNYAVGLSAMLGTGKSNCCSEINPTLSTEGGANADTKTLTEKRFTPITETGVLLNNSVTVNVTDRFFAGGDASVGAAYSRYANKIGWDAAFQFNVRVGFKF